MIPYFYPDFETAAPPDYFALVTMGDQNVVGHNLKYPQYIVCMMFNFMPKHIGQNPDRRQSHFTVNHITKITDPVLCANGDKVTGSPAVIPLWQSCRSNPVFVLKFLDHTSATSNNFQHRGCGFVQRDV